MPPKSEDAGGGKGRGRGDDGDGGDGSGGRGKPRQPREWAHSEGFPLSDVQVDAEYDGVVTNVSTYGVFVDFGAAKDGLLRVPTKNGRGYKRGMEVKSLVVLSVDADAGRVVLQPDENTLPEPPPRRPQKNTRAASEGAQPRTGPKEPREPREPREKRVWDHNEGAPLEDLREGDTYEGTITNVSPAGVFADIGAVRDARLSVTAKIGKRFRIGDVIQDCKIESIDLEKQRLAVLLPDAEEVVRDLPPKERVSAKSRPKAKAEPKAKAQVRVTSQDKPKAAKAPRENAIPLERLRIGSVVDGLVANKSQYGVFVNIGCEKDALLRVPKRIGTKFQRGDEVFGMRIEDVDLEKRQIAVALENPELSIAQEVASERVPSVGKKAAAGAPKAKAKAEVRATSPKAPPNELRHLGALAVTRFKAGSIADGMVTRIGPRGVFVDIGAVTDGLLELPRAIAKQFRIGDEVHGMTVDAVNREEERVMLTLEEPELEEPEPKSVGAKGKARANAKSTPATTNQQGLARSPAPAPRAGAKSKAKAKAKEPSVKDWGHPEGTYIEDLELGAVVPGIVTNSNNFGVFLNIGAVKDAKLQVSREDSRSFRKGDEVEVIIQIADADANQILVDLAHELQVKAPQAQPKANPRAASASGQERRPPPPPQNNSRSVGARPRLAATRTAQAPARPRPKGGASVGGPRR